jgi:hypothetical protein
MRKIYEANTAIIDGDALKSPVLERTQNNTPANEARLRGIA